MIIQNNIYNTRVHWNIIKTTYAAHTDVVQN